MFNNVTLYASYLGNASNSIPLESIFMGSIFYNYKQLLQITKEDLVNDERTFEDKIVSLLETKSEDKILFYRFSKKRHGFLYSIHKEDRLILLKMVLEVCSYDDCTINIINNQDFQSPIDYLFFLLALLQQQKRINRLNIKKKKQVTLLDFIYE